MNWLLRRSADAGATLVDSSGSERLVRLEHDGWVVEASAGRGDLRLVAETDGLVLREAGGNEIGRATPVLLPGGVLPCDVLLADGRLFRAAVRPFDPPGIELRSWEVPGAYLRASRSAGGWSIETTEAGEELEGAEDLALLIAGCLLQDERYEGG